MKRKLIFFAFLLVCGLQSGCFLLAGALLGKKILSLEGGSGDVTPYDVLPMNVVANKIEAGEQSLYGIFKLP